MKYLIYILLLVLPICGYGQVVAVQNDKENATYLGVCSPLTIAVENCPANAIVVTTDNGRIGIDSTRGQGHYLFCPALPGMATVYISRKISKGLKLLDSTRFRVKQIPLGDITLGGKRSGPFSKPLICAQIAPGATMGGGICGRLQIISFRVLVIRRGNELFNRVSQNEHGARIDSITKAFFYHLQNNDQVIFRDFTVVGPDAKPKKADQILDFTITGANGSD